MITRDPYTKRTLLLASEMVKETAKLLIDNAPLDPIRPIQVTIGEASKQRTLDQNAKFHAICEDVERSGHKFAGKPRDAAVWKVLFVSGHAIATGLGSEVMPGLEGEFVNIRESTAKMSKSRGSSLIEYTLAYCYANEIRTAA